MAFTAIAGPAANLLLGIIAAIVYAVTEVVVENNIASILQNEMLVSIVSTLLSFLYMLGVMNFTFMAFNLIPVPPFDGSRFFGMFLPTKIYFKIMRYERYILIGVLALTFLSSRFFNISPALWVADKLFGLIENAIYSLLNPTF